MGSASPASPSKVWGPRTGEPQSLRQRAPALLLRKLDEFEEMAQRVWGGTPPDGENDHENRKIWQKSEPSKAACRTPPPTSRRLQELDGRRRERLERLRVELMQQKSEESNESGNKSTPVLTTTSSTSATITTTTTTTSALKKDVEKQILIPTKTGKEPVKKLYPKDSPPDHLRARFVPVAIPIQFATGQQFSTQPLSLPLYPIQVAPVGWARYPGDFNDPNNNLNQIARAQWAAARVPVEGVPAREGRGRSRDRPDGESRRRAQSKSPARRPAANYLDNVAYDMSELSKKFREFGDAVRQRMSRKSGPPTSAGPQPQPVGDGAQLKSNLKKQRESVGVTVNGASQSIHHHGHDNKKVHFNKFATVQMME